MYILYIVFVGCARMAARRYVFVGSENRTTNNQRNA